MECYINRPAQRTNFEIIFFTILKYNNYGVPVQNCDRKQKITFQTDNLLREKVTICSRFCKLNERHITCKSCQSSYYHTFCPTFTSQKFGRERAGSREQSHKRPLNCKNTAFDSPRAIPVPQQCCVLFQPVFKWLHFMRVNRERDAIISNVNWAITMSRGLS